MPVLAVVALFTTGSLEPTGRHWAILGAATLSAAAGALVVAALLGRGGPLLHLVARAERTLCRWPAHRPGAWTAAPEWSTAVST